MRRFPAAAPGVLLFLVIAGSCLAEPGKPPDLRSIAVDATPEPITLPSNVSTGVPGWVDWVPFGPHDDPVAVYDSLGDRVLLWGGTSSAGADGFTWELRLDRAPEWRRLELGAHVGARRRHFGMLDPSGRRLISYGGDIGPVISDAVQELPLEPGSGWRTIPVAESPGQHHSGHGLESGASVHDPATGKLYIFSASSRIMYSYPNWTDEFDPSLWVLNTEPTVGFTRIPMPSETRPRVYSGSAMTLDTRRRELLLTGGHGEDDHPREVWRLGTDPLESNWELVPLSGARPPALYRARLHYDAARDRVLYIGGITVASLPPAFHVWALDRASGAWSRLSAPGAPTGKRTIAFVVPDTRRGRLLVMTGRSDAAELWSVDPAGETGWSLLMTIPAHPVPIARARQVLVYDPWLERIRQFSGSRQYTCDSYPSYFCIDFYTDAWSFAWSGGWTDHRARWNAYPGAEWMAGANDPDRKVTYLFGGRVWDTPACRHCPYYEHYPRTLAVADPSSTDAVRAVPVTGPVPSGRGHHVMAYDTKRSRVLLFGGLTNFLNRTGTVLDDLWSFDPAAGAWTDLGRPADGPVTVGGIGLYDEPLDRLLVVTPSRYSRLPLDPGDRWEHVELAPPNLPGAPSLAFDDNRRRFLLVYAEAVYALDSTRPGDGWKHVPTAGPLSIAPNLRFAYDSAMDQLVGTGPGGTWSLSFGDTLRHGALDVRPASETGLQARSLGESRVALLGRPDLDASTLDPATIRIGGASVVRLPNGGWKSHGLDVNSDGAGDLVVHVETQRLLAGAVDGRIEARGRSRQGWRIRAIGEAVRIGPLASEAGLEPGGRWAGAPALGVSSLRGNPVRGLLQLAVSLPGRSTARLEVIDVRGRRRLQRSLDGLGAGVHTVTVHEAMEAGVYFVRVLEGADLAVTRVVLLP